MCRTKAVELSERGIQIVPDARSANTFIFLAINNEAGESPAAGPLAWAAPFRAGDSARYRPPLGQQILLNILFAVELFSCTLAGHISNLPEDGPFKPRAVELSDDGPRNPRVTVGVASIQFVFIVQPHSDLAGQCRRWSPLQDFFCPVHPQIVVHPTGIDHLHLRRIPKRVVGL